MTPNIPNFPTDNLYKFKALSGVFLIFLGFVFLSWFFLNVVQELKPLIIESGTLKYEASKLDRDVSIVENQPAPTKENIISLRQKLDPLELKAIDLSSKANFLDSFFKNTSIFVMIVSISCVIWGLKFAQSGFDDWYNKLQKYQDQIIEAEAKEKLKKVM